MNSIGIYTDVALNAVLYILDCYGGSTDKHKLFKTLYFADRLHLSRYGREITRDTYIKKKYGPVPNFISDSVKGVENGKCEYASFANSLFVNGKIVSALSKCDKDYLSESDIECLGEAVDMCREKGFEELTDMSHNLAWNNAKESNAISYGDMVRECGESEEYAGYIEETVF